MAVRGKYSSAEKKMLAEYEKEADTRVGWCKPFMGTVPVVTAEMMKSLAVGSDPWNPFYRSESYAAATRWGGLIGLPWILDNYKPEGRLPVVPGDAGFRTFLWLGENWEFFQPVRPGDTIRGWARRPRLMDATGLDGKGPRKFNYVDVDGDLINQRDEIVSSVILWLEVTIHPKQPKYWFIPDYGFTLEELDYIGKVTEGEQIRGAKIRYWEDVKAGEELIPVVLGPTSINTGFPGGMPPGFGRPDEIPKRTFERYIKPTSGPVTGPWVPDPDTGLIHTHTGRHSDDRAAHFEGEPKAFLFAAQSRAALTRLVTNWMGDDGFIRKFGWRHLYRDPIGDCLIVCGKVAKKYIENGEHLIDIKGWTQNFRGNIGVVNTATVKLISKDEPYPNVKKVIKC